MKKLNKLALALGTVTTVATPVAAVVSCGSTAKKATPITTTVAAEGSIKKASGYNKMSDAEKKTFDTDLANAEKILKEDQGYDSMSKEEQAKFNADLAGMKFEDLTSKAKAIEDKNKKAAEEVNRKVAEEAVQKDSVFYSEKALIVAINGGDDHKIKTNQILKDLKRLNFKTIKNFTDTIDVDGTKEVLKAIVGQATKLTENLFPIVDRILAGLENAKVQFSVEMKKYLELYKTITNADGAAPLFDLLGSQLEDLLDKEIDKYITKDLIDKTKVAMNKYVTENYFNVAKGFLNQIDFSDLDTLGKSVFGLVNDNKNEIAGAIKSIVPQLGFLANIIDPSYKDPDVAEKTVDVKKAPVNEYQLKFNESGKMTLLKKEEEPFEAPDGSTEWNFASTTDLTKGTSIGKVGDEELTVTEKQLPENTLEADVPEKPSVVTTILGDLFGESDPQNLIGGKSDEFNRVISTVLSIIGKQTPETIAELKEILLSKIAVDYKLQADWNYDGTLLKKGTSLNIKQLETFFMDSNNTEDSTQDKNILSPFTRKIMETVGAKNKDYIKGYVPKMEPGTDFFHTPFQAKLDNKGAEVLDSNNKPIEDDADHLHEFSLKDHFDKLMDNTNPANKLYEADDNSILAKDKILGTNTTLEGVKLSDYGFKDVDAFAKVFGSTEHFGQTIDLPSELLMVRKGIKVGFHKIDILKIGIGVPATADFGTGIFKNILSTKPEDLEYSKSIAKTLGLDPEEFEQELTEYYRKSAPKTINKFEAGAFKTGQPTQEIFDKLGSKDYDAALKSMFKVAYSHVEANDGKTIQDPSDPTKTILDPTYNWDATGIHGPAKVMGAVQALQDMYDTTVEDSAGNALLTYTEPGKTTPTVIGARQAFGLLSHDLILFLQMSRDWLNTPNHGDFEAFYKAKVETQTQTVSIRAHQKAELQDAANAQFDTLRKVIESFQTGLEDVFGKATEADRDGKALLE